MCFMVIKPFALFYGKECSTTILGLYTVVGGREEVKFDMWNKVDDDVEVGILLQTNKVLVHHTYPWSSYGLSVNNIK